VVMESRRAPRTVMMGIRSTETGAQKLAMLKSGSFVLVDLNSERIPA
jgi:hypothetical protein